MNTHPKPIGLLWRVSGGLLALTLALVPASKIGTASAAWSGTPPGKFGELDCNGMSLVQHSVRPTMLCTDIRGFANLDNANTWGGKFYDNGRYIGHDEPDMTFLSNAPGSGNDVTWTETLGRDPAAHPTVAQPGNDVSHWFELSPAPWFSMALCDPNSYPLLSCTPESDKNAPACLKPSCLQNAYPGAGGAFTEMQFYPPGNAPFADSTSCDNKHWCAALNIDSLECTEGYSQCNPNCEEPVNFAFIQRGGVPAGPPSPQLSNLSTFTPNADTLLMNPGDRITIHMFDATAPAPPGETAKALEVVVKDLTTRQTGWMQASAANGFANTSIVDCTGTPFNFEPEYSTAGPRNITPWGAGTENISTEFETGHFEPCTSLSQPGILNLAPGINDKYYNSCAGPYEHAAPGGDGGAQPEASDALCYPKGDTHGFLGSPPSTMTGCQDDLLQNGDLDFDGSPYWTEWPTASKTTASLPSSFVQSLPTTAGHQYPQFFFQTDVALSESTCTPTTLKGCTVPPDGPGHFYPYWSEVKSKTGCTVNFGNVRHGRGVNNFGRDAQYGSNQYENLGYPQFIGKTYNNTCPATAARRARS